MSDPKDIPEQVEVMRKLYAPVDDFESWWREYDEVVEPERKPAEREGHE